MNRRNLLISLSATALAACGGGGGTSFAPAPVTQPPATQPTMTTIKIECFGDSTMYGSTGTQANGYTQSPNNVPAVLQSLLGSGFVVVNGGVGGSTTPQWLLGSGAPTPHAGITQTWTQRMAASDAKFVVLNTGINDSFIVGYTPSDHIAAYTTIASVARQYGKTPIFMSPNPINDVHNSQLWDLQHAIKALASDLAVPLIDQYNSVVTACPSWSEFVPDNVHPSDDLYRFMGHTAYMRILKNVSAA